MGWCSVCLGIREVLIKNVLWQRYNTDDENTHTPNLPETGTCQTFSQWACKNSTAPERQCRGFSRSKRRSAPWAGSSHPRRMKANLLELETAKPRRASGPLTEWGVQNGCEHSIFRGVPGGLRQHVTLSSQTLHKTLFTLEVNAAHQFTFKTLLCNKYSIFSGETDLPPLCGPSW